jgi:hypothetical protein
VGGVERVGLRVGLSGSRTQPSWAHTQRTLLLRYFYYIANLRMLESVLLTKTTAKLYEKNNSIPKPPS